MDKYYRLFLLVGIVWASTVCKAQLSESEMFKKREHQVNNAVLLNPSYTANFALLDLKSRFGFSSNISMLLGFRMNHNWMVGIEGSYLFGNKVKETDILNGIITNDLNLISIEGTQQRPKLSLEGFAVKLVGEKVFKVTSKLPGSGIFLQAGIGFLQHKILIQAPTRLFPQLDKTYRKGYDRMSNGALFSLSTGFKFLERKKLLSFNISAIAELGITQNRRAWDFDLDKKDTKKRTDLFVGVKLGWIIPILTNKDNVDLF